MTEKDTVVDISLIGINDIEDKKEYCCLSMGCNRTYTTMNGLLTHIKSAHINQDEYNCDICNRTFIKQSGLNNHKALYNCQGEYNCINCGLIFATRH